MAWIRFVRDKDLKPTPATTIAYRAGCEYNVPRRLATLAIAEGAAVRLRKTNKNEEAVEYGQATDDRGDAGDIPR